MSEDQKQQNDELARRLLAEQNFAAAAVVGAVAAVHGAVGFGITTTLWGYSYGFAAAGIGIVVGASMQFLGRGIDTRFAVLASVYTIIGCLLGNVLRFNLELARSLLSTPHEALPELGPMLTESVSNISFIDLVYWFVAVFAAAFLAKRPLSREQRFAIGTYRSKDR